MHPKNLSIKDFSYALPEERIAKYPLPERDESKLIVYQNERVHESTYKKIDSWLPPHSLMILNNTKVVEARILFQKPTGASIEIFCLEPHLPHQDIATAMSQKDNVEWLCLIGGASKWKAGQTLQKTISIDEIKILIEAKFIAKKKESFVVRISWNPGEFSFSEILHFAGNIPLPPYLKREPELADLERYQTTYASEEGSVAAPTAGLHFTRDVFEKIEAKKILVDNVTLHVGAGTFKPVKAPIMEAHEMHAEFLDVQLTTIKNLIAYANRPIIAVGTTSLRTIESLYWMGVKILLGETDSAEDLVVQQWDPYDIGAHEITAKQALEALLHWMTTRKLTRLFTKTQILIAPGYSFKITSTLITNFHQPQSTLLLLVAAFVGEDWRKLYEYALENNFRFLSYGDGCLLFRNESFL
ncbi:MAG: S-adenosylmethionine:tRNA ribosyltransferase-isomerase [Flavitalea sp.]